MDRDDLEKEMNSVMDRLTKKSSNPNPYSTDPLSSDHFILARSWEFFKKRIAAIEKQWQEIVNAKTDETRILKKELQAAQERLNELEQANTSMVEMLAQFKVARLQDFQEFQKKNEKLKMAWDEERITIESNVRRMEHELEREKKKAENASAAQQKRILFLENALKDLKTQNQEIVIKMAESQTEAHKIAVEKDDDLSAQEGKIDLLRRELERRDQVIRDLQQALRDNEDKSNLLQNKIEAQLDQLAKKDERHANLQTQMEILKREKAELLDTWNREKAEWRELWERAREVWKKDPSTKLD